MAGGLPANPAAWLLVVARRRIVDRVRSELVAARKEPLLQVEASVQAEADRAVEDPRGPWADERLRLVFLCAHPTLAPEVASALTLRLVLGVPTRDLASLFQVSESTMAARLTRAKHKLVAAQAAFALPQGPELERRQATVAQVAYLAFTAGYAPPSGTGVAQPGLAGEAIRLVRLLRDLLPQVAQLDALLALMLLQHSPRDARSDGESRVVLLPKQNRARWRGDEIGEALALLAPLMGRTWPGRTGAYFLQALIAAEHAVSRTAAETRWDRIAGYYAELEGLTGSAVVRLNRAVAVAEVDGPAAALALLDGLDSALPRSHRVSAVRAELLVRSHRPEEAREAYQVALARCRNEAEVAHLRRRLADLG